MRLCLELNGQQAVVEAPPLEPLVDVLHRRLGIASVRHGCRDGACGACHVLLDGAPVPSCVVPAIQADGAQVTTFEGLADDELLAPVFSRLRRSRTPPCDLCLPGLIVGARAFLDPELRLADESALESLAGNPCRCEGLAPFARMLDGVARAAPRARPQASPRRKR